MRVRVLPLLSLCLAAASCAHTGGKKEKAKEERAAPAFPMVSPPQMRGQLSSGTPVASGGNFNPAEMTAEEDIAWTNPDNPDAGVPDLQVSLGPQSRGPWEDDFSVAAKRAMREGKPMLVWFTDSMTSPGCKALSAELFESQGFPQWAGEHFVRLRVDSRTRVKDDNLSIDESTTKEINQRNYVTDMKRRFKVLGNPTLLIVNPGGEVIGRYKGYKSGQAEFTWGLLRQGEVASRKSLGDWRSGLEKKGYREWEDRSGRKVFAKLVSYSNGELQLVEPDGQRSKTPENRLSDDDRGWIKQQKELRGLH